MPIRVLIVDDHAVVRQGLKMFLKADRDLHIVGEATNGEEAVRAAHEHQMQLSPAVAAQLMRQVKLPESPDALTERGTKFSNSSRAADRTRTLAGLAEMRALIMELRPESLKSEGLVNVLKRQAEAMRVRHHLRVDTDFCDEPALSFEAKEALYRIGQEAMHNAVKHARATRVTLRLCEIDEMVELDVCDDGDGFDASAAFPGHFGLRSMRERATRCEGTLVVESAPQRGTCIRARIPMRK